MKRKGQTVEMNGATFAAYANAKTTAEKIAMARNAPKVSAGFLDDLPEQLGLTPGETAKAMGIADGVFYRFRSLDECPAFILERANEVLAEKGLAPVGEKKERKQEFPRTPRTKQADMVPADFLIGLETRLGIEVGELCELLGVKNHGTYFAWRKRGKCPSYIRAAVNGLLAERKIQTGELTTRKPKKEQVPTVAQVAEAVHANMVVIQILVPANQVTVASAMLAACGFPIQIGR